MSLRNLFNHPKKPSDTPWSGTASVRFIRGRDVRAEDTWRLLNWCRVKGVTEFSFTETAMQGIPQDPDVLSVLEALYPYQMEDSVRPNLTTGAEDRFRRTVPLWRLTPESSEILKAAFPSGLLLYESGTSGWLEDPMFYREGELFLGAISHENEAALQATAAEYAEIQSLGYKLYDEGEWI